MKGRKRYMRKFTIGELSYVDVPAQEGARALILKRGNPADRGRDPASIEKDDLVQLVTGSTDGHQHGIRVRRYSDGDLSIYLTYAQAEDSDNGHDHPIVLADGVYTIVENAGHTHSLDSAALSAAIIATVQKEASVDPKEAQKLKEANERLEKIVAMKADHRLYFDQLTDDDHRTKFLAKSDAERGALIAEAQKRADDDDPVVHKTKAGLEIRKSDGPTMLAMAKAQDEQFEKTVKLEEENAALKAARTDADYEKRAATELPHHPGTIKTRAFLLKQAESLEDEDERKDAVAALKAKSDRMSPYFKDLGTAAAPPSAEPETGDPQAELDKLVEKRMEEKGEVEAVAQEAVLKTVKGQELYDRIVKEHREIAKAA